jgi:hypothetical protein
VQISEDGEAGTTPREGAMIRILTLCAMALSICGSAIAAEPSENGRYQAVTIEMGDTGLTPEVLILDTRDGHLWRYWQEPRMGKTQGSEGVKYLMQVRPGTKPREVVGFVAPLLEVAEMA